MDTAKNNQNSQHGQGAPRGGRGRGGRPGGRPERPKSEFDQAIVDIRRVTRVVRGGRRFSFSLVLAAGNRRGKIGLGVGKSGDISSAIEKAFHQAKKQMLTLRLSKTSSIPHEVSVKFAGSRLLLKPAPGRGLVAGSAPRSILNLAGVRDVTAKILSKSKNKLNNARATMVALEHFAQS